jgi:hypothetical protein
MFYLEKNGFCYLWYINFQGPVNSQRAVAQTVFLDPLLRDVQKSLFAAKKSFFDESGARLHFTSNTRRSGSNPADRGTKNWEGNNLNSHSEPPFPPSAGMCFRNYRLLHSEGFGQQVIQLLRLMNKKTADSLTTERKVINFFGRSYRVLFSFASKPPCPFMNTESSTARGAVNSAGEGLKLFSLSTASR